MALPPRGREGRLRACESALRKACGDCCTGTLAMTLQTGRSGWLTERPCVRLVLLFLRSRRARERPLMWTGGRSSGSTLAAAASFSRAAWSSSARCRWRSAFRLSASASASRSSSLLLHGGRSSRPDASSLSTEIAGDDGARLLLLVPTLDALSPKPKLVSSLWRRARAMVLDGGDRCGDDCGEDALVASCQP